ncbi:MAG: Ldh family oxidoreductase [Haliscomenobacter sp.]|nr:Ldh family oxidoreductase [Haliscomenobacter sp.]MBK7476328.1 Ldh family oxidoreductase [Haliscomenobacter sp.]
MQVGLKALEELVTGILLQEGFSEKEIELTLPVLMYAQCRGNNQGVVKLTGKGLSRPPSDGLVKTVFETPVSQVIDGGQHLGMVVMQEATSRAIEKASGLGVSFIATRNTASSTGAIGFYAKKMAEAGLIGMVFSGSFPAVAPAGAKEPLFGTNPIAIGIPSDAGPIVLDMATASMAWFGVMESLLAGAPLPPGIAINPAGEETLDPESALKGAILPFGNHKGSGLSFMIEVLTGPLIGASFLGLGKGDWGNLILCFHPRLFGDPQTFIQSMNAFVARVKSAEKMPGLEEIFLPGERGNRMAAQAATSGVLEIEDKLYHALLAKGRRV